MKRSFPRAVPEAIGLLGLLVLVGGGCSPESNVKPGAPVLLSLAIVETGGTATTITADTNACPAGAQSAKLQTGDACKPADGDTVCKLAEDEWCRCIPDMMDMTMMKGSWNCDPFAPMSMVIATFDRLLDTDPLDPGDAATTRDDIAALTATPAPATMIGSETNYQSNGSPSGAIFNVFGPAFFGNFRSGGPSLAVAGAPALPTSSSISVTLDGTKVLAKDGKSRTLETDGMLPDGKKYHAKYVFDKQ